MRKIFLLLFLITFTLTACDIDISTTPASVELGLNPSIDTIEVGTPYTDQGAYAYLTRGETRVEALDVEIIENTVNTDSEGEYTITYETTHDDIKYQVTRKVYVVNELPLEASLNPGVDTVFLNTDYTDPGVSVNKDDVEIVTMGSVDTSVETTYTITYTITDSTGNQIILTRYVHVKA